MKLNPKYQLLECPKYRYFMVSGGRASAKSFAVADFIVRLTYEPDHVILFTRYTMKSAEISIIPEFLQKIKIRSLFFDFEISKDQIVNKTSKSRIFFRGIKTSEGIQTANLKSIEGLTTWVIDEAEEIPSEEVFDNIDESIRHKFKHNRVIFVLNPSKVSHWIYKRFYQNTPYGFCGVHNDVVYIHTTYLENAINLSKSFLLTAKKTEKENPLKYKHRYLGYWQTETANALWSSSDIVIKQAPADLHRILVSIDPAITSYSNSDETGIVVVGKDSLGNGYVLADLSGTYKPEQWAKKALQAYEVYRADAIVVEVNQGGEMVISTIRQFDKQAKIITVNATRGKRLRAEPVSALYNQGKVFHVKHFEKLEEQMLSWDFEKNEKSPDRIDALVHGLTKLLINKDFYCV